MIVDGGLLYIACDIDVEYTAISRKTGTPINSGTCTYELFTVFDGVETLISSGDVPYVSASAGQYYTNIPSTETDLEPETVCILRITFTGGGQDDVVEKRKIARRKS